ncbi:hypothetical protein CI109_106592 [Kwoniella shandongensis]|uniref:Uncharacterized protein n=1 Tax=Kwoniella shandongensis TaxID=1734106 RepID=A0A5M6C1L4_9TREE|nr:uncharacterized protein CI109_002775 [Kwoniella shandongensis]KAA5529017.1 hypothetical protein CI109_002775 [Kwoniella shandongensis]
MKFLVIGGGGKVALHFTRIAVEAGHKVHSVIKDDGHTSELEKLGAKVHIASLVDNTVPDFTSLLTTVKPDTVVFAAGSGGKPPGPEKIDYEGAVKVFDAMEASNTKRLVLVGAVDVRTRDKGYPEWYNDKDKEMSDRVWKGIGPYMEAKLKAELELHSRKSIKFTVLSPGGLTLEPAGKAVLGRTHLTQTSRELVAQVILAAATTPGTEGLTIDVMDGEESIDSALAEVVKNKTDAWTG